MSDIRGLLILSRLDFLEKFEENQVYRQVMQKVSESVRQSIGEQVFLTSLYPFHLLQELDAAIGETINQPLEGIFCEVGNQYAQLILDRYFYNYIESQNPHKYLAQMENLYPHLWYFGNYSYQKVDDYTAGVQFDYDEDIHKSYCWFIQGYLKKGIQICGGKSVQVKEEYCEAEDGEYCKYQIKWQ